MKMNFDYFDEVEGTGPAQMDVGEYEVEVTKAEPKTSQKNGRAGTIFHCKVLDGPAMSDGSSPEGKTLRFSIWAALPSEDAEKKKTMSNMAKRWVKAFGLPTDEGFPDVEDFVGEVARVETKKNDRGYVEIDNPA